MSIPEIGSEIRTLSENIYHKNIKLKRLSLKIKYVIEFDALFSDNCIGTNTLKNEYCFFWSQCLQ